jgi:hypothetical protein
VEEDCPKFEDKKISNKFLAEMEMHKIDSWSAFEKETNGAANRSCPGRPETTWRLFCSKSFLL